jgi:hypothetical protein
MMESSRINLDGTWNFIHVDDRAMSPVEVRQIHVPSPWQAQFRDLRTRSGTGIYGRTIDIAQSWLVPSASSSTSALQNARHPADHGCGSGAVIGRNTCVSTGMRTY